MKKIISRSEKETAAFGEKLANKMKGGEIIAITGNLGAGKTKLVQGLAKGLGVSGRVNSPTFNILKIYRLRRPGRIKAFCHIDAYRLNSAKDLVALGVGELFGRPEVVTAIEWAEKVKRILPPRAIKINIDYFCENKRKIGVN